MGAALRTCLPVVGGFAVMAVLTVVSIPIVFRANGLRLPQQSTNAGPPEIPTSILPYYAVANGIAAAAGTLVAGGTGGRMHALLLLAFCFFMFAVDVWKSADERPVVFSASIGASLLIGGTAGIAAAAALNSRLTGKVKV